MRRTARADEGGLVYHALNRGNNRATVFHDAEDYDAFVELIGLACERRRMRVLGFCLMPNHCHLAVRPFEDGDLGRWMQWLLTSQVRRHRRRYGGSGHVWPRIDPAPTRSAIEDAGSQRKKVECPLFPF